MEYTTRTLPCRPDDEGEVVATLVSTPHAHPGARPRAVLALHGFVDYFFHDHVAQAFDARGHAFYALDLRKYGRSLRPHQHPNACRSLYAYYEEIGRAIALMESDGVRDITLLGHSTGGLIACLYARDGARRDAIRRLVLNSPFFEFNEPAYLRAFVGAVADRLADRFPYAVLPKGLSPRYGESLHKEHRGEWSYNLAWKPIAGFPVYLGWVRAVRAGQRRLRQGLDLRLPILLLHSDRSVKAERRWRDAFFSVDAVLDVAHMKRYGPCLGPDVTLTEIAGGMHDLYLSRPEVRAAALEATFAWLERRGG